RVVLPRAAGPQRRPAGPAGADPARGVGHRLPARAPLPAGVRRAAAPQARGRPGSSSAPAHDIGTRLHAGAVTASRSRMEGRRPRQEGVKILASPPPQRVDGAVDRTPRTTILVAVALVGPLAVCALLATLRDVVPNDNAALVLVLVVVAVAAAGHRPSAVVAALSCAVWFDFFLTRPYHSFTINSRDDVETAVLLVLVGRAVTESALWGRRQQGRAGRRQGYLDGVTDAARMAAEGDTPPDAVVSFIGDQITHVLGVDRCVFKPGNPGPHPRINRDG